MLVRTNVDKKANGFWTQYNDIISYDYVHLPQLGNSFYFFLFFFFLLLFPKPSAFEPLNAQCLNLERLYTYPEDSALSEIKGATMRIPFKRIIQNFELLEQDFQERFDFQKFQDR